MQIVTPPTSPVAVGFGVTVDIVRNGRPMRIQIVGEDEAEPSEGRLAWTSPLARALEGAAAREEVEFRSATKSEIIEVVALS